MIIHKRCYICGKIGHRTDMVKHTVYGIRPGTACDVRSHEDCYKEKYNSKKCTCGKGWVRNENT